jgi:molybdopterin-guanine dinucleotide biosynthesis protein A
VQCAGILLTGGSSRRLGVDKARLRVGGVTLAERAARVLAEVCDPVVEVGDGVSRLRSVREQPAGSGPLAAIIAGHDALLERESGDAIVVLACDLVRVGAPMVRLLAAWPGNESVVPSAGGRAQYVCARNTGAVLATGREQLARGEHSMRFVDECDAVTFVDEAVWEPVGGAGVFDDLDTSEDALRLGIALPPTA